MAITLAFDVYGTLINTQGVVATLEKWIGEQAEAFSQTWRDKQLEYSFRRGLMQNYQPFSVCTADALQYTCQRYNIQLSAQQKQIVLAAYLTLPAFADVQPALAMLKKKGTRLFAFSNGETSAVDALLKHAGIRDYFEGIVSCEDVMSFKPNPAVYHFLESETDTPVSELWLVSSNPFDVIGAISSGIRGAWLKRSNSAIFDPWGIEPTQTLTDLQELAKI
ncbi:MAG: haloacid dehalogenase type II [Psychromonas sp.]